MTIGRIIEHWERDIVHCSPQTSVQDAVRRLADYRIGAMPVVENGDVLGIISERDVLYGIAREGNAVLHREVSAIMTTPAITAEPETTAIEAASLMTTRRIRHLPVMEDGHLIAFVSIGDIVKYRLDQIEHEAEAMRDYIRTA